MRAGEAYTRKYVTLESVAGYVRSKHISRARDPVGDLPEHVQHGFIGSGRALAQLIKMPEIRLRELAPLLVHDEVAALPEILDQVEHDFPGMPDSIDLQRNGKLKRLEKNGIAASRRISTTTASHRSRRKCERLKRSRPDSLLAAEHMRGITPAALSALSVLWKWTLRRQPAIHLVNQSERQHEPLDTGTFVALPLEPAHPAGGRARP